VTGYRDKEYRVSPAGYADGVSFLVPPDKPIPELDLHQCSDIDEAYELQKSIRSEGRYAEVLQ